MAKIVIRRPFRAGSLVFAGSIDDAFSGGFISSEEATLFKVTLKDLIDRSVGTRDPVSGIEIYEGTTGEVSITIRPEV